MRGKFHFHHRNALRVNCLKKDPCFLRMVRRLIFEVLAIVIDFFFNGTVVSVVVLGEVLLD